MPADRHKKSSTDRRLDQARIIERRSTISAVALERALRVIDRKREELQKAEQDQSQLFQESLLLARKLATAQARIARLRQELDAASSKTKAAFEEEEASIEEQENFEKEIGISLSEVGDLESFDFEAFLNNDVASLNA
ncbi:hypothetical protein Dda_4758 [Drechslerella dactyloides]|uniref:Uncharacterized protein n=1 Tax=Drechslerella dactyloides TaxID=74499 RepID=A0AAD6J1W9_DREDA|nr:hypothetical protein Dda_8026 [Drechslerella dactyloides]KAJ6258179.1 hypothetical protein Dda_7098 [Drechslerella dactyloides]KAJ6260532.1 hypothetical protein Dda_4758 [Drechslerella dactyloides]